MTETPRVQIIAGRYISHGQLDGFLERKFPEKNYWYEGTLDDRWIISVPVELTKAEIESIYKTPTSNTLNTAGNHCQNPAATCLPSSPQNPQNTQSTGSPPSNPSQQSPTHGAKSSRQPKKSALERLLARLKDFFLKRVPPTQRFP